MTDPGLLAGISGERVLDVATGHGGFVHFLIDELDDYSEIIGIDANPAAAEPFAAAFREYPNVRFEQMNALDMPIPDAAFDTVAISHSLHHFADPNSVLRQMTRVLRPGGHVIVQEMYRDNQTEVQMTHVLFHHWSAKIHRLAGIVHRETYTRAELVSLVEDLGLADLRLADRRDTGDDPKNPEEIDAMESYIAPLIEQAEAHPDLVAEGEAIRERLHRIGIHPPTMLVAVGAKRKPATAIG